MIFFSNEGEVEIKMSEQTFAKQLRKKQTDTERYLWQYLRSRQLARFKFRRQHKVGPYIADFICLHAKLIVELDGGQHLDQKEYDAKRTVYLESRGFQVLRFWNNDIFKNTEAVLEKIYQTLKILPYPHC